MILLAVFNREFQEKVSWLGRVKVRAKSPDVIIPRPDPDPKKFVNEKEKFLSLIEQGQGQG